jgi:hypothetical protein
MTTVFHIGFSKTGTSALQTTFFPSLDGWAYVGQGSSRFAEFQPLFAALIEASDHEYDPAPMRRLLERTLAGRAGVVVSREQFTTFHRGGRTARRLHAVVPDAKILLCVRNQCTRLPSAYSQYVRRGGVAPFDEWMEHVRDPDRDRYDTVVGLYQELFGRDAVKVMLFEQLVQDELRFLDDVYAFMTSGERSRVRSQPLPSANTSLAPSTISILRRVNRVTAPLRRHRKGWSLQRRIHRFAERWPTVHSREPARDAEALARLVPRYAESNARLAQLTGLDLAFYGYPLPEGARHVAD